jgi:hypothetical protein
MTMRKLTAITACWCWAAAIVSGLPASSSQAAKETIEQMPAKLETEFALSALPAGMRGHARVYLLDLKKGYQRSQPGTSGVTCLVERTAWKRADFRKLCAYRDVLCVPKKGTEGR